MNFMPVRPAGFNEEITSPSSSSSPLTGGGVATVLLPGSSPTTNDDSEDHLQLIQSGRGSTVVEKEHMFDKVVTPSDVGKLNRLVIPKQHAEKYFPLDSSTNEKGLLLNFEDRNGKPWRFRYSYWNSSQSYVMTKGWSRFVKEKKLDAGDIVLFLREIGVGELGQNRLFIDWRRRQDAPNLLPMLSSIPAAHNFSLYNRPNWNQYPQFLQSREYSPYPYGPNNYGGYGTVVNGNPCPPGSIVYLRSGAAVVGGGGIGGGFFTGGGAIRPRDSQMVYEAVPVVQGKVAGKRLRLFGVNMDCPINNSEDECEILSNHSATLQQYFPSSTTTISPTSSSSSSLVPNNSQQTKPGYGYNDEKGKGSMSLDLDM